MLRDYVFHESTVSLCPTCVRTVQAKVIIRDDRVYLLKYCPDHGQQVELLEEDAEYHLAKRQYDKPGNVTRSYTGVVAGCSMSRSARSRT